MTRSLTRLPLLIVLALLVGTPFSAAAQLTTGGPYIYPFYDGDEIGLMDETGRILESPRFTEAGEAVAGYIPVRDGNRWGMWSSQEERMIIPAEYVEVRATDTDNALVRTTEGWWLYPLTAPALDAALGEYEQIRPPTAGILAFAIREDRGPVDERTRWGLMDTGGTVLVEPSYANMLGFSEGVAATRVSRKFLFIKRSPLWGYLDAEGSWVIEPRFDSARSFSQGRALVSIGGELVFIDSSGDIVFDLDYELAYSFVDGRARVMSDGLWGWINLEGREVIEPGWEGALDFSDGVAAVSRGGKWGFVDRNGNLVLPLTYDIARPFNGPLAFVRKDGRGFYIDRSGSEIEPRVGE